MNNFTFLILFLSCFSFSQVTQRAWNALERASVNYTPSELIERSENNYETNINMSIVKNVEVTNIGPSIMSGRVTDIEVNPINPTEFFVAYASGGLWHTVNNGTTFKPIMDNSMTQNIGDFSVDWSSRAIYVGTGESNSSRSSYPGIGILKSLDNGESWENIGLRDTHHISRIIINPNDNQHIVVAAIGHLYSSNRQRGIFNSYDGGKTWSKSLYVNVNTGAIDLVFDPNNFDIQYAAFWERSRTAWNFMGSGKNSAIYKTVNGGKSWDKITTKDSGFPTGSGVGRIGLAIYDSNIIYAVLDNQFRRKAEEKPTGIQRIDFKDMPKQDFMSLDNEKLNLFIKNNGFDKALNSDKLKARIQSDELKPQDIYRFLTDANAELFDTPVIGAEVYKSVDGGNSWKKQNDEYLDGVYNSYGYYFGRIHVSPTNSNQIYVYGVPILKSNDSGKSFERIGASNVHVDHHDLWINPQNTDHLVLGNDGGVNISYDEGANWIKLNQPSVGQFYSINVDNSEPYNVYGGLQDNGVWMAKNNSVESPYWYESGHNNWTKIMGGDGMQIQIDNRDNNIVYTGLQFGNYYRLNISQGTRKSIKPRHKLGESPLRFNWQTPILISPHNQDIIYFGSNKLHRSFNQGETWTDISNDLTKGGKKGNVPYGTLTCIDESVFSFGKIVVGSDDGNIVLTQNSGESWKNISSDLPSNLWDGLWISRVIFSKHKDQRIYAALNGYRNNDFKPYLYVSEDNGNSWNEISPSRLMDHMHRIGHPGFREPANLPLSPINVVREDIKNENILYLGTDNGLFISFDRGYHWHPFSNNLPRVAIHDLVIHEGTNELVIGTHGRSIYKIELDLFSKYLGSKDENFFVSKFEVTNSDENILSLLNLEDIRFSNSWGKKIIYSTQNLSPNLVLDLFSSKNGNFEFEILNAKYKTLNKGNFDVDHGFNKIKIPIVIDKKFSSNYLKKIGLVLEKSDDGNRYLTKGKYILKVDNQELSFLVK